MSDPLFTEFSPATHDEWVAAARASLRGEDLESLRKSSYEGIEIDPLTSADGLADCKHLGSLPGQYPFVRGSTAAGYRAQPWLIAQEIDISDPEEFNAALREALASGQTAIVLNESLRLDSWRDLQQALADIDLGRYPLFLRGGDHARQIYRMLQSHLRRGEFSRLSGYVAFDPLAQLARTGSTPADAFERLAALVEDAGKYAPQLGSIAIDTGVYHDAGADAVQELAIALASALEYLRRPGAGGLDPALMAGKLHFQLNIGENFFMEVAKFRAVKLLWTQVMRALGVPVSGQNIRLHARCGGRNKTRRGPHMNILRATSEALAAAIGGVDALTIAAFDQPLGVSNAFSRRLARNLQLILQEELQLTQLIDPAGGAWHIEKLTDQLARLAWTRFQEIEAQGGMLAALQSGDIQAEIESTAEKRRRDLATGAAVLVGVNQFADPDETSPPARQQPRPKPTDESADDIIRVKPLRPLRLEDSWEAPLEPESRS